MAQYIGVSFKRQGQIYFFLATPFVLSLHDKVLVKTDEGIGFGEIVTLREAVPEGLDPETIKPIYRPANQEDEDIHLENQALAEEAKKFCQVCVERLNLNMKLVGVDVFFDKSKMIFFFTAPGRVDFRELVKDLVRTYRTRIELRQIGVRHETQMIGALGNCGQVCCCRRYLRRFEPVTIKMAKDQNLFLNPAKISGACGRLLCCLAYEKDNYADFQHRVPKIGRRYMTSQGLMKILRTNMFHDSITVLTEVGDEAEFPLTQWEAMVMNQPPSRIVEHPASEVPAEFEALVDPKLQRKRPSSNQVVAKARHQRPRSSPGPGRQEQVDSSSSAEKNIAAAATAPAKNKPEAESPLPEQRKHPHKFKRRSTRSSRDFRAKRSQSTKQK